MRRLKIYILTGVAAMFTSCSDFLDTIPHDALSPATTWQTEVDAQKFAVGCYDGWEDGGTLLYMDCASDFGYNNFSWEGFRPLGDGSATPSNPGNKFYDFSIIRRCNTFMENIDKVEFEDPTVKKDLIAQVRAIRAYRYFILNFLYGGVPIIDSYNSAQEAQVPRETEDKVKQFVYDELDALIPDLNVKPEARGRIAKGGALAIKMRSALYWGDLERAQKTAQDIMDLGQYELEKGQPDSYANLFKVSGQDSKEIILAVQYIASVKTLYTIGQMYNNADGGWSSIVPTQNLVDAYEMATGLTKEEAGNAYDPVHPFYGRDPRMAMTIMVPGTEWKGSILNTLDQKVDNPAKPGEQIDNKNYPTKEDNASKTALTWRKYLDPMDQYPNMWEATACPIVFRYAEVLLTYVETTNELTGPSADLYDMIDQIRLRAGMPKVDRTKYATKEQLRELIRRERAVEFAGEGLRRADILRWKDNSGKMLAETLMNGTLTRIVGTIDYNETNPYKRAKIDVNATMEQKKIEDRTFQPYQRYLPIPQEFMDKNLKLVQNPGYGK
ncbi:RagB/SusD family nutrient uptake outer membrane protein [Bacteroides sp.]